MRTDKSPRTMDDDKVNDEGVVVSVHVLATQSQFKLPRQGMPVARKREAFFGLMLRSPEHRFSVIFSIIIFRLRLTCFAQAQALSQLYESSVYRI